MVYRLGEQQCRNFELSSRREWILTNGAGSYAMGTASGANTRRYHGHLVATVRPPLERYVLLSNIEATVEVDGRTIDLSTNQYAGAVHPEGYLNLTEFSVDGAARWLFSAAGAAVEKCLWLQPRACACGISYRNTGTRAVHLILRPMVQCKFYHGNFHASPDYPEGFEEGSECYSIRHAGAFLRICHPGAERSLIHSWYYRLEHLREHERGLDPYDDVFCPAELRYDLPPGESVTLDVETEEQVRRWSQMDFLPAGPPQTLRTGLTRAAEQFLVKVGDRTTILAGYPWFTDWGRDTMIALPGVCLHTGRWAEAKSILQGFIAQIHQGLIPNRIAEHGEREYNTADATLWFVHAAYRALDHQWDDELAAACRAAFQEIFDWHQKGTLYGIGVDPEDGLLRQGEEGVQLTWMDAKVGDHVITPRRGKAVEINGLWINALRVMSWLKTKLDEDPAAEDAAADKANQSFEARFWNEDLGYYIDVADPEDCSLRPNQLIALSLPFVNLNEDHAKSAIGTAGRELLTPRGLRTLAPDDPNYRGRFEGSMSDRDGAYHQGTVWPWLLGPYVTALVRYTGDKRQAKRVMRYAKEMLEDYGLGGIAEVYDGDAPHQPGGCPWQAWSVAELLRVWVEDLNGD